MTFGAGGSLTTFTSLHFRQAIDNSKIEFRDKIYFNNNEGKKILLIRRSREIKAPYRLSASWKLCHCGTAK